MSQYKDGHSALIAKSSPSTGLMATGFGTKIILPHLMQPSQKSKEISND